MINNRIPRFDHSKCKQKRTLFTWLKEWIFKHEIEMIKNEVDLCRLARIEFEKVGEHLTDIIGRVDASVDVHEFMPSSSWAVVSLQGRESDYIKFVNLRDSDIRDIHRFISRYEKSKIDASPGASAILRVSRKNKRF